MSIINALSILLLITIAKYNGQPSRQPSVSCALTINDISLTEDNRIKVFATGSEVRSTTRIIRNGIPEIEPGGPINYTVPDAVYYDIDGNGESYFHGTEICQTLRGRQRCTRLNNTVLPTPLELGLQNEPNRTLESIRSFTWVTESIILIVEATVCTNLQGRQCLQSKSNVIFQVLIDSNGASNWYQFDERVTTDKAPTAMVSYRALANDSQTNVAIVVFNHFWDEYIMYQSTWNVPLVLDMTRNYKMSRLLLGCPVELCFEADLDAAYTTIRSATTYEINLLRGYYYWTLEFDTSGTPLLLSTIGPETFPTLNSVQGFVDAAYAIGTDSYFIRDNDLFGLSAQGRLNTSSIQSQFAGFRGQVSAAFYDIQSASVCLIESDQFTMYSIGTDGAATFTRTGQIATEWPGVPIDLDAATQIDNSPTHITVALMKGNFIWQLTIFANTSQTVEPPKLFQEMLGCNDSFYALNTGPQLGLTTYRQFEQWRRRLIQPPTASTPITPITPSASSAPSIPSIAMNSIAIYVIAALVGIAVLAPLIVLFVKRQKKRNSEDSTAFKFGQLDDGIGQEQTFNSVLDTTLGENTINTNAKDSPVNANVKEPKTQLDNFDTINFNTVNAAPIERKVSTSKKMKHK